ncbi:MAG: alpha/beta hydrolase [Nocardioides sp.]|uniref:alpha/beta hydrolase n=1 Tax=Nocardioides sp. TaxID=35761 RepID=UPI0039E55114
MPRFTARPATVTDFGNDVLAVSAILDDLGSTAYRSARTDDWQGVAAESYRSSVRRVGRRADAMAAAARTVGLRVLDHADALSALHGRHRDLERRYRELEAAGAGPVGPVAGVPGDAPHGYGPSVEPPGQHDALVASYERDRSAWLADLHEAEQSMLAAFGRADGERRVLRRYGGRPDPADGLTIPDPGADPLAVRRWWDSLTQPQRDALLTESPERLGNLDGLPASVRDAANRIRLGRDLITLETYPSGTLSDEERDRLANARALSRALARIDRRLGNDPLTGEPVPTQIYLYDPDSFAHDGRVAVGIGDLDAAPNVAITVPGVGTDAGSASDQATKAINLYQASRYLSPGTPTATMFWIGYDAPDKTDDGTGDDHYWTGLSNESRAVDGGRLLGHAIDGLTTMRDDDPHLTIIGHSYGSTTATYGVDDARPGEVDDLVLAGSPGAGTEHDHASDLTVPDGHVYVARNSGDPIAEIGDHPDLTGAGAGLALGPDPAADDFGAIRVEAEDVDRDDRGSQGWIANHTSYFDHDTESLANIAHVATGDYAHVTTTDPVVADDDPGLRDIGSGVGHTVSGLEHGLRAGYSALFGLGGAGDELADGGRDLAGGIDSLTGTSDDPEADRDPTTPRTH